MSRKYFRSLIALLAMGLLVVGGGTALAASHEEGEEFTSDFIEGEEEGPRIEVLEGYVSPGVITDSMLLNAGKKTNPHLTRYQVAGEAGNVYSFAVMPLALDGKIITGTSGAEFGIRGFITARDAETGEEVWKTHTLPAPDEPGGDTWPGDTYKYGGGSAWVTGAYDPELNNIYWGVGQWGVEQPGPWDRHAHPGDSLYTNSTIVAGGDSLYTNSTIVAGLAYCFGVSFFISFELCWEPEPPSKPPSEPPCRPGQTPGPPGQTPGPMCLPPSDPRCILNPHSPQCRDGAPPETDVTRDKVSAGIYPALFGGKEWNPMMAYDPNTQIAYVPSFGDHSMDLQTKKEKYTRDELYLGIKVMKFYGGGGELRAIDARNGELVWVQHNNPMPFRSSIAATAGNLVFAGDTEGYIKAFNATHRRAGLELPLMGVSTFGRLTAFGLP